MRELDIFQSYFDNMGVPLYGRLRFCDNNNAPQQVYDASGTSIGTYILTDGIGKTSSQVFLGDTDYTIYFDRWDGMGLMDASSDEDWTEVGSAKSICQKDEEIDGSGIVHSVDNIAGLRNTSSASIDSNNIILLGYTTKGDKPPVNYIWDANCTDTDNGGSVIQVNGISAGRWVLSLTNNYVDARDFGAFPLQTATGDATQTTKILLAKNYATAMKLNLYFGGSGYYDISNLSITGLICGSGCWVLGRTNTSTTIYNCDTNVKVYSASGLDGTMNLHGERFKTSQDVGNLGSVRFNPTIELIIDSANWTPGANANSFSNIQVMLTEATASPLAFTNCTFVSANKLTATSTNTLTFTKCNLAESMFNSLASISHCTFNSCTVLDWNNVAFLTSVDTSGFYDFKGKTYTGTTLPNGNYSNGTFIANIDSSTSNVTMTNCSLASLTVAVGVLKNCTVSGNLVAVSQVPNSCCIDITDTTVAGYVQTNILKAKRCAITGSVTVVDTGTIDESNVAGTITGSGNLTTRNSTFPNTINIGGALKMNDCITSVGIYASMVDLDNTIINGAVTMTVPTGGTSNIVIRDSVVSYIMGAGYNVPTNWDIDGIRYTNNAGGGILVAGTYDQGNSCYAQNIQGAISNGVMSKGDCVAWYGKQSCKDALYADSRVIANELYLNGNTLLEVTTSESDSVATATEAAAGKLTGYQVSESATCMIKMVKNLSGSTKTVRRWYTGTSGTGQDVRDNFSLAYIPNNATGVFVSAGLAVGSIGTYSQWYYLGYMNIPTTL